MDRKNKKIKPQNKVVDNVDENCDELVAEVLEDFFTRQHERRAFENKWQLNINYFMGNQFSYINTNGEIMDSQRQYFWEERSVYNHIAPILELRLSKLNRVRPSVAVVPFSDEQKDIHSAKVSKKLLNAISKNLNISKIIADATLWSEICGTVFYKIGWDYSKGKILATDEESRMIREGEVEVNIVTPFELYPDSDSHANIEDCKSIIFARAFHKDKVKSIWGVDVMGKDIDVVSMQAVANAGGLGYNSVTMGLGRKIKKDHVLVLEKYETPTVEHPLGRLIIIAGDRLVYLGELPYENGKNGTRAFPFIKQNAISIPHSFWGMSVVERCIPIQRAFNSVKNRKHEYINRLTMGVLAVEDGSIDMDNLEEEGLSPGKVLIYRQGSEPPKLLSSGTVPAEFEKEENQLLDEFLKVSGVSDLFNSSKLFTNMSGVALQLLIEQDDMRLVGSAEEIRVSAMEMAKVILRLCKQFATLPQTYRILGDNGDVEMFYWSKSDLGSEDVVFENENEMNDTIAQRRSMIFEVLNAGLLHDENGILSNSVRSKILQQLGVGIWQSEQDIKSMQINSAQKENLKLINQHIMDAPKEIDDHELHINEHICYMLTDEFAKLASKNKGIETKILQHISIHKDLLKREKESECEQKDNA